MPARSACIHQIPTYPKDVVFESATDPSEEIHIVWHRVLLMYTLVV